MFTIQDLVAIEGTATLRKRQSTFIVVEINGNLFRVNFFRKCEFNLLAYATGRLSYHINHPLLVDYNEGTITTYINSRAADPEAFIQDLQQEINKIFQGWRDWRTGFFLNDPEGATSLAVQNLRVGSGILTDQLPVPTHDCLINVCQKHGVEIKSFGGIRPERQCALLFIGATSYVIAEAFQVKLIE